MKRKLFFLERLLYGDGKEPFNAVFAVRISGAPSVENLYYALEKIQAKHPLLRSRVVDHEDGTPYFIVDEAPPRIPMRVVQRRSDEDWIRESKLEWMMPFDMERGTMIRIVWLQSAVVCDLLLSFHHCICNGSSCMLLMQEILTLMDTPALDIGSYDHFITPEEMLAEARASNGDKRKARLKAMFFGAFFSCKAAMISTKKAVSRSREKDYLVNWKLDEQTSVAVFQHCKHMRVTVNSALCAAFLHAFRSVKGKGVYTKVTCPVDIRKYLPAAKRDDLFSFGLSITLGTSADGYKDFGDEAMKMQKDAEEKMKKLNAASFLLPLEYAHRVFRPLMKVLRYGKRRTNLILSNLGRLEIEREYGSFRVDTVYSPTVIGSFGDPTDIVTTTYGGQMDFCFLSNEEFVSQAEAHAIRARAMELLIPK